MVRPSDPDSEEKEAVSEDKEGILLRPDQMQEGRQRAEEKRRMNKTVTKKRCFPPPTQSIILSLFFPLRAPGSGCLPGVTV